MAERSIYDDKRSDVEAFGYNVWVYCAQHMRAEKTGWCTVSNAHKVGLGVKTEAEAKEKCRLLGLKLYEDQTT